MARVYTVDQVPPEVLAYAMARYSRSRRSLAEQLAEITREGAQAFLETFYYAYGHASIADLAHVALAVEDLSLLAAMEVVDEPLWDGQERSTRYQDFAAGSWYRPEGAGPAYDRAVQALLELYRSETEHAFRRLREDHPRPPEMDEAFWRRTLKARALDVSRGFLPLAMKTALGQITSARVLEEQLVRLRTAPWAELRQLADQIEAAVKRQPPVRPSATALEGKQPLLPTLAKYTEPTPYRLAWARRLEELVEALAPYVDETAPSPPVALHLPEDWGLHALATAAYAASRWRYQQVVEAWGRCQPLQRARWLDALLEARGPHDPWPRTFRAAPLVFDLELDLGAFRDFNRHRRLAKVHQRLWPELGYSPEAFGQPLSPSARQQLDGHYHSLASYSPAERPYLLPLAHRRRMLLAMDWAEAAYLIELRTRPQGHPSYRRVAWEMYRALDARFPELTRHIRAVAPEVEDLFRR